MSISDYTLERYHLGELSAVERAAIEAQLTDGDHDRLQALKASDAEILARYPARVVKLDIERKQRGARRSVWAPAIGGLAMAGALAVAAVVYVQTPVQPAGYVGIKAQAHIVIKRQAGLDSVHILADEAEVSEGDVLQLTLHPGDDTWGVAVSIDGRGAVTQHYPRDSDLSGELNPGRPNLLAEAYRLDDAPEFERFFLVTHSDSFGVPQVLAAARALANDPDAARDSELELPPEFHIVDHLVVKVTP